MDRRLILAVALSAIVLVVYQTFMAPKPQPRQPRTAASGDSLLETHEREQPPVTPSGDFSAATGREQGAETPRETPPVAADPLISATTLDAAVEESETEIVTELFTARFTNRGAQISSFELNQFLGPDKTHPVQLVNDQGEFGVLLETPSGEMDLSGTLFELRRESGSNGATRLVYSTGGDGLRVTKTYTIPREGYAIDLDVRIEGAQRATGFRLVWDGGIPPADGDRLYKSSVASIAMLGQDKETVRPGAFKKEARKELEGTVRWAGVRNKYFTALAIPPESVSNRVVVTGDNARQVTGTQIAVPVVQGVADQRFMLFLGPLDHQILGGLGHDLDQAIDLGWKVFRPISAGLLEVMTWMYRFIPNYGLVIIIISILTKVLFYPLTKSSVRSMRAMQLLQPEMQALKEKYKGDPKRMQEETMALYRKHKINPVGGCLPLVVQMPVFFALYSVLSNSIAMRSAEFVGWINDLSVPDTLFAVGGFPIHILPLIMFASSVVQAKLTPTGADPRQKMMGYMMPAVLLFIFYSFPAGLNLYWTVNNILTVAQQWHIHREHPAPQAAPAKA
jgi:YidC/Oxa1 family membrane protein insertase